MKTKNLCIIPARSGSKRIQKKNIKLFFGKPIITYSIEAAIKSNLFDEIIVSTDDNEIAEIAIQSGAKVPFFRSSENSDDNATTADVIVEVINQLKVYYENICCLYPTAPLVLKSSLIDAYNLFMSKNYDSVFPISKFSHPINRALTINNQDKVEMIWPKNQSKRSQDLPTAYYDSGQFYWIDSHKILKTNKLYTENSGYILLKTNQVQDIDNEEDWQIAELKYKLLKQL